MVFRGSYALPLLVFMLTGCQDDGRRPTYPVTGKVVYDDGSPLPGGTILCLSDSKHGDVLSARANINDDGSFVLGTYDSTDGAVTGRHLVAIVPPTPPDYNPDAGPPPRMLSPRFESHDTSQLSFDVSADGPNEITLTVSRP